jgi:hypothetical protein
MALFRLQYLFSPSAPFGLPDGVKIVLPSGPQEIYGPFIHLKSGVISSHGTLSQYRKPEEALSGTFGDDAPALSINDNFAILTVAAESAQQAYESGQPLIERLCHAMSIQTSQRFSAVLQFIEDEAEQVSVPQPPQVLPLGTTSTYNISKLNEQFAVSFSWAQHADDRIAKALLYTEHALLLSEFAQSQGPLSRQAAFSRGFAFLQLFKALAAILGEKGVDRDHQRRFRELGLPDTFWKERVEPLYRVRNDDDVAHYTLAPPDPGKYTTDFGKALTVLREAFTAYADILTTSRDSKPGDA